MNLSTFAVPAKVTLVACAAALLCMGAPSLTSHQAAVAQTGGVGSLVESISIPELTALMKEEGYTTALDKDGDVQWKIDGYNTYMFVSEDKKSLQFYSGFNNDNGEVTLKRINEWNKTKRFSRTYLNDEGAPYLELDLDLDGGVSKARIKDYFKTCRISFETWVSQVINGEK